MNWLNRKLLVFDKGILLLTFLISLIFVFIVAAFIITGNYNRKNSILRNKITNIQSISGSVRSIKETVESREKKINASSSKGVVSAFEGILKTLGMKAAAIKPLEKKKTDTYVEDRAELEINSTDLNSIVNLLYKIENSPAPMKINSAAMSTTFENPDKFILKLTVSLLSK